MQKKTRIAGKNTCQMQSKRTAMAGKTNSNCTQKYLLSHRKWREEDIEQFNKGSQMMQRLIWLNSLLLSKCGNRRCPTITPSPATMPRSLRTECSAETWIVHIGLTGTGDRTAYFKMLPKHCPRRRRSFSLAPKHRTLHRVRRTSGGCRNSNVFHLSLLHNIRNADATTSSIITCW